MRLKDDTDIKDSGVDWLGKIPTNWRVLRMKDIVASMSSGGTPKATVEDFYSDEGVDWVTIADMSSVDCVEGTAKHLSAKGVADKNLELHPAGTVLYSMYATIGKVSELAVPATINQAMLAIQFKKIVDKAFVKYALRAFEPWAIAETTESTQKNLNAEKVKRFSLPIPQMQSQRRIVSYLDEKTAAIDERVAVLEKKLAAYKRLKTSVINRAVTRGVPGWGERDDQDHRDERDESRKPLGPHCRAANGAKAQGRRVPEVAEVSCVPCHGHPVDRPLRDSGVDWIGKVPVGWKIAHLKRLTKKIGSGKTPSGGAEIYGTEGVMFLRSQNVYDEGLSLDDVAFISSEIDAEMASTRVVKGDVLLNITGGSIGRCCVYERSDPANVNQHVCIIRADANLSHDAFIKYFWNSLGQEYLRLSQLGGNRESLNFEQIGNAPFPCPPLPEQRAIADYLDAECAKIDKMAALVTREIELYKNLKRSLINEVVTGKREVA